MAVNADLVEVGEVAWCGLQLRLSEHAYCGVFASLASLHRFSDAFELICMLLSKPALFGRESAVLDHPSATAAHRTLPPKQQLRSGLAWEFKNYGFIENYSTFLNSISPSLHNLTFRVGVQSTL